MASNELAIRPVEATFVDIEKMAVRGARSKIIKDMSEDQLYILMQVAASNGIPPIRAMQMYSVIQGKPAMKSEAMLAVWQETGGSVEWLEHSGKVVTGLFTHPRYCPKGYTRSVRFDEFPDLNRKDTWRQYPEAMLTARCVSAAIRAVAPALILGTYTPEEIRDFSPESPRTEPEHDRTVTAPTPETKQLEAPSALVADQARAIEDKGKLPQRQQVDPWIAAKKKEICNALKSAQTVEQVEAIGSGEDFVACGGTENKALVNFYNEQLARVRAATPLLDYGVAEPEDEAVL
jgi:hypothetical protein